MEYWSTGVWALVLTITPTLHYPILRHPQGSTGIRSHLFSPIIFSGSMRDSTSSEIASRSANGLPTGLVQSKPALAVTLRSGALGSSGDPFIPGATPSRDPPGNECQGQEHFALVEDVHVLVKYEGMLDIEEAAERGGPRGC